MKPTYSQHNLHHVNGSRTLDPDGHSGSNLSDSSSRTSSKITRSKHYNGPYGKDTNHSHDHGNGHGHAHSLSHSRSRSNSTTTNNSILHKKSSHLFSPSTSTLDPGGHPGASLSDSTTNASSKITRTKHYNGPYGKDTNHSHDHGHGQAHNRSHSRSLSNSTTANNSILHKGSSQLSSPSTSTLDPGSHPSASLSDSTTSGSSKITRPKHDNGPYGKDTNHSHDHGHGDAHNRSRSSNNSTATNNGILHKKSSHLSFPSTSALDPGSHPAGSLSESTTSASSQITRTKHDNGPYGKNTNHSPDHGHGDAHSRSHSRSRSHNSSSTTNNNILHKKSSHLSSPTLHPGSYSGGNLSDSSSSTSSKITRTKYYNASYGKDTNHSQDYGHAHRRSHSRSHSNNSILHKESSDLSAPSSSTSVTEIDNGTRHSMNTLAGTPIFLDKNKGHHGFIKSIRQLGLPKPGRSRRWPYLGYMANGFKNLALTFYFNWTMIFTAPISSIAFITVYPSTVVFLVGFEVGLKLFMETWRGSDVLRYISLKYGQGFGAINWGSPELLLSDSSCRLVQNTLPNLGATATPISMSGYRQRTFDLSIAQTLVLLSSLIYERDAEKVKEAYDLYNSSWDRVKIQTLDKKIPEANAEDSIESRMRELLWESEFRIRQIAESWGLQFAGISELKSLGGPFCGIFWSETIPFIIVAFKGTTPTNYEEFLVDATFQRTDARSFLFGCVHEGFYESLFSTSGLGDQDVRDPYGAILATVQTKAMHIQEQLGTTEPVQLWVTGHSLGAALSSLLFSRWLKCPEDLSHRLVLRDAYILGTPAVGDSDFASHFSSYTNQPVTRSSTMFRIINESDIICRLPPGYNSKTCGHFVSESDFFNYSHVGHAVQITPKCHSKPLKTYPSSYQPPMQVNIVTNSNSSSSDGSNSSTVHDNDRTSLQQANPYNKKLLSTKQQLPTLPRWANFFINKSWIQRFVPNRNPIHFIEKLYPFFLKDHIPSQYFQGLERARIYYENEEAEYTRSQNQMMTDSLIVK